MSASRRLPRILIIFSLLLMFCCAAVSHAASIGALRGVTGTVDILRNGKLPAIAAKNGDPVSPGDLVRTKANGHAEIAYHDGTTLTLAPGTRLDIGEHFSGKNPSGGEVKLARGKIQAIVDLSKSPGQPGMKKFDVRTPNAIAGVRGTNFFVSHYRGVTNVLLRTGTVTSYNPARPTVLVTLTPNTITTVTGRLAPTPPRPALEREIRNIQLGITPPAGQQGDQPGGNGTQPAPSGSSGQQSSSGSTGSSSAATTATDSSPAAASASTASATTPAASVVQTTTTPTGASITGTASVASQVSLVTTPVVAMPTVAIPTIQQIVTTPPIIVAPPPPPPPPPTPTPGTVNVRVGVSF